MTHAIIAIFTTNANGQQKHHSLLKIMNCFNSALLTREVIVVHKTLTRRNKNPCSNKQKAIGNRKLMVYTDSNRRIKTLTMLQLLVVFRSQTSTLFCY
ncbi:CLUMA_CG019218, isoform A [Clunio marinus]|uniref:CLUMA_CG019218, isoform A n=1 Tax=Clunio marinus TaxID=568069 RepID=A0A1J1J509_9DIPT|nr:CLUMA_CG019218, isoform A [Clunio marinus]